jgi:hypothetical protein
VLDIIRLTVIPAVTLVSAIWAATLFPYQPTYSSPSQRYIDEWKLNEPVVCQAFGFDHQEYEEWLQKQ